MSGWTVLVVAWVAGAPVTFGVLVAVAAVSAWADRRRRAARRVRRGEQAFRDVVSGR